VPPDGRLPLHISKPFPLTLPSAGSPKAHRLSVGLDDDRLAPLRSRLSQTRLRCDQEPAAKPLTTEFGSDDKAIDGSSPAVPCGNNGADDAPFVVSQE